MRSEICANNWTINRSGKATSSFSCPEACTNLPFTSLPKMDTFPHRTHSPSHCKCKETRRKKKNNVRVLLPAWPPALLHPCAPWHWTLAVLHQGFHGFHEVPVTRDPFVRGSLLSCRKQRIPRLRFVRLLSQLHTKHAMKQTCFAVPTAV